jgi:hypothetical protein
MECGSKIKIDRAKRHFLELKGAVEDYVSSNPYTVVVDDQPETREKICRLKQIHSIPANLSAIIGDTIHNLRCALDQVAVELAIANGNTSNTAIKDEDFERSLRKKFRFASPKAQKLVRRLKPIKPGVLWKIHQLDILDKHCSIIPVGIFKGQVGYSYPVFPGRIANELMDVHFQIKLPTLWNPFSAKGRALRDGDVIHIMYAGPGRMTMHIEGLAETVVAVPPEPKLDLTFEIAFGQDQIMDGEPIIPTLQQFIDFVERTIEIIRKNCIA